MNKMDFDSALRRQVMSLPELMRQQYADLEPKTRTVLSTPEIFNIQRIALARALAVKPGILVMDDTTSAVDMETEKYIQAQLRQLPYDCTKLIIAQRISSVKDADLILILKDGVVTERGTHQELLRQRGYYYETYCLQNGITPDTAPQEVM